MRYGLWHWIDGQSLLVPFYYLSFVCFRSYTSPFTLNLLVCLSFCSIMDFFPFGSVMCGLRYGYVNVTVDGPSQAPPHQICQCANFVIDM